MRSPANLGEKFLVSQNLSSQRNSCSSLTSVCSFFQRPPAYICLMGKTHLLCGMRVGLEIASALTRPFHQVSTRYA